MLTALLLLMPSTYAAGAAGMGTPVVGGGLAGPAQDGAEAIAVAQQTAPDIVLMDIQMPRMDGLRAIRSLREDPAFRKTPIIALTALAMPGDRERCLEAGADDYVGKPVGLKELDQTIQRWIKRT